MHPLVGLDFSAATLTPHEDLAPGGGVLGKPVWGPLEFLRDLELRLGLGTPEASEALRTTRWAARMHARVAIAQPSPFYAASFAIDPLGTATGVLALRDALVETGWDGRYVPEGGRRLDALAELEELATPALPPCSADRVLAVARALADHPIALYAALDLAEPVTCWSRGWQRVFQALAERGTAVAQLDVNLPGAPPDTDLGKVQTALSGGSAADMDLKGDSSFVMLTAETAIEAARAAAAFLSTEDPRETVVIREDDAASLEHALMAQGLPSQGLHSSSPWRPLLQLLPLALELAFEPKDPYRVLELVSLPKGPFRGNVGRRLARSLSRSPGIGGRAWEEAKAQLPEPREEMLRRIAEWFETRGADPIEGAAKETLIEVVGRVRAWLASRLPTTPEDATLYAALVQCDALLEALLEEPRTKLDLVAVRRLADFVLPGTRLEVLPEQLGRVAHTASPGGLWVARKTVLWWPFTHRYQRSSSPWRREEHAALLRAGWEPGDALLDLQRRTQGWHRALRAATGRLVLIVPRTHAGQTLAPHPLWDELVARLNLDETRRARLMRSSKELLAGNPFHVPTEALPPLALPAPTPEWNLQLSQAPDFQTHSAASLEALLGCPLSWVLRYLAGLNSEQSGLPAQQLLNGSLGHRLLEELHCKSAFGLDKDAFVSLAKAELELLFEREGAPVLRPGKVHELEQLRRQLLDAAEELWALLKRNGLTVLSMEQAFTAPWRDGELVGRWDLLAKDAAERRFIIDLKWGFRSYADGLKQGTALQLAAYQHGLGAEHPEVSALYFSLSRRRLFGHVSSGLTGLSVIAAPSLADTWSTVERTVPLVEQRVRAGALPVTGLVRSLPLLETLGIPEPEWPRHFTLPAERACQYCNFDALCGRRWEGFGR
jgi:ATP-dependent helicase/nuclease subunit B